MSEQPVFGAHHVSQFRATSRDAAGGTVGGAAVKAGLGLGATGEHPLAAIAIATTASQLGLLGNVFMERVWLLTAWRQDARSDARRIPWP